MGVSGVVSGQVPWFSGAVNDAHSSQASLSVPPRVVFSFAAGGPFSGGKLRFGLGCSRSSSSRHRRAVEFSNSGFADNGHLDYYRGRPRCGGDKEKSLGAMTTKKKLKLLKGLLSEDLSMFSEMGSGYGDVGTQTGLVGEVQGRLISEAAEVLIKQLQHVRAEEKDMKRKKKMEKAKLKASRMKESSSSSSSSSSESERGEVMDMSSLRREVLEQPIIDVTQNQASATLIVLAPSAQIGSVTEASGSEDRSALVTLEKDSSANHSSSNSCSNVIPVSATGSVLTKGIEVCMGKKCMKSGAQALLEEFERVVGIEGAVVGCKCMGKCKDGPNVRVLNPVQSEMMDDSVRTPSNPLCVNVGLEDVDLIVAKFLGEDRKDLGVAPVS